MANDDSADSRAEHEQRSGERARTGVNSLPEIGADLEPSEQGLSRRELLKRVGILGATVILPTSVVSSVAAQEHAPSSLETLTVEEWETLEAIVARLIPSDENGPGAIEARATTYIDRALAGPLASSRSSYASGLTAVNRYSQISRGAAFATLPPEEQDAVLTEMESNTATGFTPDSSTFFSLLRTHTIEGTFSDPFYGGNANFVGWDLIGYPGVRVLVTADEQRMGVDVPPTRKSAYDYPMFSKEGV